jgi:hypothetical protein
MVIGEKLDILPSFREHHRSAAAVARVSRRRSAHSAANLCAALS